MKLISYSFSTLLLLGVPQWSLAKVSEQEASQLGKTLTPVGATKQGNKAGTIPAYKGGLAQDKDANPYEDIYAHEAPLFVIDQSNLAQHKQNLTPGQLAMFAKYPKSYKMAIYPSHRTASLSQDVMDNAKKNATQAQLVAGGNGLKQFEGNIPFAIPNSGVEVIWNHITGYKGGNVHVATASNIVEPDGSFSTMTISTKFAYPESLPGGRDPKKDKNILFYTLDYTKAPARLTGNVSLVHETIDQLSQPRKAWIYNAGQRRVRRAPQVGYDAPTHEGIRTVDQVAMFNGSPDRFDWKLVGKKEIYIPYNSYKIIDKNTKYADIVAPGHINQDYARYELHRVWHVQGTLKEGARHVYGKRDLYMDEDSWQVAVADHYDERGQIWRLAEGHSMQFVNANAAWYVAMTSYDLFSGRYQVDLRGEEKAPFDFGMKMKRKHFTTSALRRTGR